MRTPKEKEKARDGYALISECGNHLLQTTYEHVWSAQETTISQKKYMVESFNSKRNKTCSTNRDMQTYIDSVKMEHAAYPEQNTGY